MRANDSSDANVASNPYRADNIEVEKLLEINSEENHDDVCLSYVFTYRNFTDGVLGLAWVGEAGAYTLLNLLNDTEEGHEKTAISINAVRRGSRGGEMGEFSSPAPFSEPPSFFFFFLIPQILE